MSCHRCNQPNLPHRDRRWEVTCLACGIIWRIPFSETPKLGERFHSPCCGLGARVAVREVAVMIDEANLPTHAVTPDGTLYVSPVVRTKKRKRSLWQRFKSLWTRPA